MITEEIINQRYIKDTIHKGLKLITDIQEEVINEHLNVVSGNLKKMVSSRPFEENGQRFGVRTLTYMRFLDIKYSKGHGYRRASGLALYNRAIWGVLYHETLPALRFGLTEDIKQSITENLKDGQATTG